MFGRRFRCLLTLSLLGFGPFAAGQGVPPVPAPPTPTIWRFLGIPQGAQKLWDVSVNRRGNFPRLERKPPLKALADPANLFSDNPAIKAAAEIKQAEDMKAQKIKAIKYLASIGCGCYDKEGKITEALLAATDDCTPDVRKAAIEAFEEAAKGEKCVKCGSTSCCSEKVTKRLSEIAYERDDTGCPIEPDAEIREAAARVLKICCPGGQPFGPIEEETPEPIPAPPPAPEGEGAGGEGLRGEGTAEEGADPTAVEVDVETEVEVEVSEGDGTALSQPRSGVDLAPFELSSPVQVKLGDLTTIGGTQVRPVVLQPVTFASEESDPFTERTPSPSPVADEPTEATPAEQESSNDLKAAPATNDAAVATQTEAEPRPVAASTPIAAEVLSVDYRSGQVQLRATGGKPIATGSSVVVYHAYLTGERLVGHLIVRSSQGGRAIATATDPRTVKHLQAGDRAVCH